MIYTQRVISVVTAIVMTTMSVANPITVNDGDVEPTENDSIIEVVESESVEVVETIETNETEPTETTENEVKPITFKVTAYCPCEKCSDNWGRMTATGVIAKQGRTIAVDPKYIPYGTEVIINGNTYVAEDCGGAIKGNRVDIYFDSHQDALNFGVQYLEGVIVK